MAVRSFENPAVRGERVVILGDLLSKVVVDNEPDDRGDRRTIESTYVLVRYPDGEVGAVRESDIEEARE